MNEAGVMIARGNLVPEERFDSEPRSLFISAIGKSPETLTKHDRLATSPELRVLANARYLRDFQVVYNLEVG